MLLHGSGDEEIEFYYEMEDHRYFYRKPFEGIIPNLERRYQETDSDYKREIIEFYMGIVPCPTCKGSKIKKESLHIRVSNRSIYDVTRFTIKELLKFLNSLRLSKKEKEIKRINDNYDQFEALFPRKLR